MGFEERFGSQTVNQDILSAVYSIMCGEVLLDGCIQSSATSKYSFVLYLGTPNPGHKPNFKCSYSEYKPRKLVPKEKKHEDFNSENFL